MTTTSTVEDEVVEACVEYTAEQSRDVRRMVDLLRICGEIAEAEGDQKVQKKHFVGALEQLCKSLRDQTCS